MKIVNGVEVLTTIEELVDPAHCAVLVIDVQNNGLKTLTYEEPGFESSGTQVSNLAAIVPNIQRLLTAARHAGLFVAYAQWIDRSRDGASLVNGPHLYCHRDDAAPPNVIEGSWESQTVEQLAPQSGDYVFDKSWSSAFHHNYYPVLVRDCAGSYNQASHELALKWLETKFPVYDRQEIEATWKKMG